MSEHTYQFSDPEAVTRYAEGPPRLVPGFVDLQLGPLNSGVSLHEGYIDVAPEGPFDAATCLLTLHFVPVEERRRLKPGAPFVVAHLSFSQHNDDRALWLSRYVAYAVDSGVPREKAESARTAMDAQLFILTPEQDESVLRDAGFSHTSLFYTGFAFRGWVAYA